MTLRQVAMRAASALVERPRGEQPPHLLQALAGPLARRGLEVHQPAVRGAARPASGESAEEEAQRLQALQRHSGQLAYYQVLLQRKGTP